MDAFDLFKTLSTGSNFNKKRFKNDASRFQIKKEFANEVEIKIEPEDVENPGQCKRKWIETVENEDPNLIDEPSEVELKQDTLTLLGDISVSINGSTRKKKKRKVVTEDKKIQQEREQINHFRNINKISVIGGHIPDPIREFKDLLSRYNVAEDILKNIENCGYTSPTPIQMQAIPNLLEKRQTLACAPTGSGKTAAFLVPIIQHLEGPRKKGFRAVILCPTRELVKQTYRECTRLSEGREFRTHIISNTKQALEKYGSKSSQKFDILITTPKRLLFLMNQDPPAISLANVEWLIVDEADKLFEDGPRSFRDQLQQITKACTNEKLCRAMFSATNTPVVTKWCRKNLKQLINVTIGQRNAATELVEQELLFVGSERGKLIALRNIVGKGMTPPVLVFVQTKERAEELFNELIYDGINVDVIHADRTQTQRDNVIRCFREGKIWLLICTELMSRGIDFKGVNLVINYDFPPSAISYIHRIGRTGRAGHHGRAITFFAEQDIVNLRSIAAIMRASGCEVPEYMLAMKKHNKREKKKLEKMAPKRESISTMIKSKKIIKKDSEKAKKTDKKISKSKLSSGKKIKK